AVRHDEARERFLRPSRDRDRRRVAVRDLRYPAREAGAERTGAAVTKTGHIVALAAGGLAARVLPLAPSAGARATDAVQVQTAAALQNALANAQPGLTIQLAGGFYAPTTTFEVRVGGITLEGPQSGVPAVLSGANVSTAAQGGSQSLDVLDVDPSL